MKIVILAAGFGSRLWPLSTSQKPKQFQPLLGQLSLLRYTYELFAKIFGPDNIYVLTLQGLGQTVAEQIPELSSEHCISVPERRNTLPHAVFALNAIAASPDEPIMFTTVDHLIIDEEKFIASLQKLLKDKTLGSKIVTLLGNKSSLFDANAGYFSIDEDRHIKRFIEKPTPQAIELLSQNGDSVYKDTAIFITSKMAFADALATIPGETSQQAQKLLDSHDGQRNAHFLAMPLIDIATGFYEKATNLQADFTEGDFIDLGSYGSLYEARPKDSQDNVVTGHVLVDEHSKNNLIINQTSKPLAVIKMNNSVIIQGEAGTVVGPRSDINSIGELYKTQIHPLEV